MKLGRDVRARSPYSSRSARDSYPSTSTTICEGKTFCAFFASGKLRLFGDRGENDEDDEEHQQHVRKRRDVDRRHHLFFALSTSSPPQQLVVSLPKTYEVTKPTSSRPVDARRIEDANDQPVRRLHIGRQRNVFVTAVRLRVGEVAVDRLLGTISCCRRKSCLFR